ncbi:GNAT family N-acetyltransferase [Xinfangfangia sp. CPCC 101601]|uniref:GNAT family N-acetyltransferase n=1 Tax=Pseudogemmobacter lacusdianii TaxID=3069608 RepID=A0ABU0VUG9_9RHOB|nr:GNAT family N-acetyltransferase [Xinfangfangia sp. CPCC 101601]MDQ2065374.1 GNAT family N-acetyltransferase [Xinfangfangia sp. CPCC 101601]
MTLTIRDAILEDEQAWRRLWAGYLDYYEVSLTPEVTDNTWRNLMAPQAPLKARMAVMGDVAVGFAMNLHHPSSWVIGEDCYLEDLFVDPAHRGAGIGRALIDDLVALARAKGWHRLYWHTRHDNARARQLYDQYVKTDDHIRYRLPLQG